MPVMMVLRHSSIVLRALFPCLKQVIWLNLDKMQGRIRDFSYVSQIFLHLRGKNRFSSSGGEGVPLTEGGTMQINCILFYKKVLHKNDCFTKY